LLEVTQLFAGQTRHFAQQIELVVVLKHELKRRPGRLLLAIIGSASMGS
jgi:hypothetical protein